MPRPGLPCLPRSLPNDHNRFGLRFLVRPRLLELPDPFHRLRFSANWPKEPACSM